MFPNALYVPKAGQISREQVQRPASAALEKLSFFSLRSRDGATTYLNFAFPGIFLPNYSALLLHWKIPASASFYLDNNF